MKNSVNILGTKYKIRSSIKDDEYLKEKGYGGYCTNNTKLIVIGTKNMFGKYSDEEYLLRANRYLRHEILHAFLNESGLKDNSCDTNGGWSNNEEMVDWFAIQSPKIFQVYKILNILENKE